MDAGPLDVLDDRRDPRVLAVAEDVDVELERTFEEAVDERGGRELELGRCPRDAHAAAAEHVGRPDEDGIAEELGELARLRPSCRRAPRQAPAARARRAARRSGRGPRRCRWRREGRRAAERRPRPGRQRARAASGPRARGRRRAAARARPRRGRAPASPAPDRAGRRCRSRSTPSPGSSSRARPRARAGGRPAPPARSSSRTRSPGRSGSCPSRAGRSLPSLSPRRRRSRARGSSTASAPRTRRRRSRPPAVPAGHGALRTSDSETPRIRAIRPSGSPKRFAASTSPCVGEIALGGADRLDLGREIGMEAGNLRQRVARLDTLERLQQRLRERAAEAERLADGPHLGPERRACCRETSRSRSGAPSRRCSRGPARTRRSTRR